MWKAVRYIILTLNTFIEVFIRSTDEDL